MHRVHGAARPATAQSPGMPPGEEEEEPELPHPFFTHMGLPEGVGNFNLRVLGLATSADGQTKADFAFHLETGLTRVIGQPHPDVGRLHLDARQPAGGIQPGAPLQPAAPPHSTMRRRPSMAAMSVTPQAARAGCGLRAQPRAVTGVSA